ncbi:hypothetical protein BACCOPRO_01605 [Phocaeicola coprophilus DSM 18228 = JCM 13818]|uniref:Uncharacterized protein n=1 Tax=Phocaeicola coprophilus DSM 18228 = JCM 13818 TaxID=547042 RepID=S0F706_9BACT|nr:hypothetical protein BACCOPRO_01605 [Phocaeicola coprophilus DSM 18228 = JCM 13818]
MTRKNVGKGFIVSPGKHHKTRSGFRYKEADQREMKQLKKYSYDIQRIYARERL